MALASSYTNLLGVIEDAGLGEEIIPAGSVIAFARDGRFHYLDGAHPVRDGLRLKLLSPRSRLAMGKIAIDLLRIRRSLDYEDLWKASRFDTESAADYAARRLNQEIFDYVVDLNVRSWTCARAEEVSKVDFFFSIAKWIGAKYFVFRDGTGSYCDLLSRRFDVTLQAQVVAVEQVGDGVRITYRDGQNIERAEELSGCVLAVPAAKAAALLPGLDPWRKSFLERIRYTKQVLVSAAQSRPLPEQPATMVSCPARSIPAWSGSTCPGTLLLDASRPAREWCRSTPAGTWHPS